MNDGQSTGICEWMDGRLLSFLLYPSPYLTFEGLKGRFLDLITMLAPGFLVNGV